MKDRKRNDSWKTVKTKRSRTPSTAMIVCQSKFVSVDEWVAEVMPQ